MKEDKKIINIISNRKGMALLTTLIFVFILVTFAVALLTMTGNDSKMSTLQRASTQAFYQAETGIEKAIWYLNSSEDNSLGLYFVGFLHGGNATEFYDVDISEIDLGPPEIKTLISTGKVVEGGEYNKGTRTIEVKLKKGVAPSGGLSYSHAIFTNGDMTFHGDINIWGNIHSNEDIIISSSEVFDLENGIATAVGTNDYDVEGGNQPEQEFPTIAWDYFQDLAERKVDGGNYYNSSYTFNVPDTKLTGIHFIEGDVIIKTDVTLINAAIFATGTITVLGNGDVTLGNKLAEHPLALIAKKDITIGGKVHGEGIIQSTEGSFTNNGSVEIREGAVYADLGTFNGGGAMEFNVYYGTALADMIVPGTGIPVWQKISWREVYL